MAIEKILFRLREGADDFYIADEVDDFLDTIEDWVYEIQNLLNRDLIEDAEERLEDLKKFIY